jgi:hypothetical protein
VRVMAAQIGYVRQLMTWPDWTQSRSAGV